MTGRELDDAASAASAASPASPASPASAAREQHVPPGRRRYLALRAVTDEFLGALRYLNQVTIAMRAGMLDLEGAAQEIDATEEQLHDLVRRMRDVAGLDTLEA